MLLARLQREPIRGLAVRIDGRADETARYWAGIFRVKGPAKVDRKSIARSFLRSGGVLRGTGTAKAYWTTRAKLRSRTLRAGWYVYGVQLVAEMNRKRTSTFVGRPFRVGKPL